MLDWETENRNGITFHIGTFGHQRRAQIRESAKGVAFQFKGERFGLNSGRYRNADSVDAAQAVCNALLRRPRKQMRKGVEIMRRLRHA